MPKVNLNHFVEQCFLGDKCLSKKYILRYVSELRVEGLPPLGLGKLFCKEGILNASVVIDL